MTVFEQFLVETEYYVYCDDDFVFNTNTNLDSFLDIIEKTGYDLIGGGVGTTSLNTWRRHGKYKVKRGSTGYCVNRENGFYGTLEGFKNCQVGDVVANFFIARTLTAGTVRFDPLFKQIAHREYFLDAIGKLRIAVWLVIINNVIPLLSNNYVMTSLCGNYVMTISAHTLQWITSHKHVKVVWLTT